MHFAQVFTMTQQLDVPWPRGWTVRWNPLRWLSVLRLDVELLVPEGASWMYTAALLALVLLVFPFLYYVAEGFWGDAHVWKRSHAVGGGPTRRLQEIWALWSRGMIVALCCGGGALVMKTGRRDEDDDDKDCLLYTSPSPRDRQKSRMPSSA